MRRYRFRPAAVAALLWLCVGAACAPVMTPPEPTTVRAIN